MGCAIKYLLGLPWVRIFPGMGDRHVRLRLREVLAGLRVTESELARRLGRDRQYVASLLEREQERVAGGPRNGVTLATLEDIANALEVEPLVLLESHRD